MTMTKTGSSRRRRGAEPRGRAAALLLGLAATAQAQTASPPDQPLAVALKASTQPVRQLASNLRGDTVVLLSDQPQGARHLAIVALSLRQPGPLLDLPRAYKQVDEVMVDCASATRSVWRSDVYAVGDAVETPSRRQLVPTDQRRTQVLADLALTDGLMASALRTLCSTGGVPLREPVVAAAPAPAPQPPPAAAPTGPVAQTAPTAPGGVGPAPGAAPAPPAATDPLTANDGRDTPPPGSSPPPQWPTLDPAAPGQAPGGGLPPGDLASRPPFAGSAFPLGVMGLLAEYVYYDEERLRLLDATRAKLERIRNSLDATHDGPLPLSRQGLLIRAVRASYEKAEKDWAHYQAKLEDKQRFLSVQAQLLPQALPAAAAVPLSSFRGELYRHASSGETLLVFRGSHSALDWLTNLWLGIDLAQQEAPNYNVARQVAAAVVKGGARPIVVGHSLGAGMAQYVGALNGLRVVGFNSSPLPERYLTGRAADPALVRLFSALETGVVDEAAPAGSAPPKLRRDLVSLGIPDVGEWASQNDRPLGFLKAHQHLHKPVCVVSRPQPFTTPREDEQLMAIVSRFVAKGMFSGVLMPGIGNLHKSAPSEAAMKVAIKALMSGEMKQPLFMPDSRSAFDQAVAEEIADRVKVAAIQSYQKYFTVAAVGRTAVEYKWGAKWKVFAELGASAAKAYAGYRLVTDVLRPHSMDRLNRGLQGAWSGDVFDTAAVEDRCIGPLAVN